MPDLAGDLAQLVFPNQVRAPAARKPTALSGEAVRDVIVRVSPNVGVQDLGCRLM